MNQSIEQTDSHKVGGSDQVNKPVVLVSAAAGPSNNTHDNADSSAESSNDEDTRSAWSTSSDSSSTDSTTESEQQEEDELARKRRELEAEVARGKIIELHQFPYKGREGSMPWTWMKGFMGIREKSEMRNMASFSNMRRNRLSPKADSFNQPQRGNRTASSALATYIVCDDEAEFASEEENVERPRSRSINPVEYSSSPISPLFQSELEAPTRPASPVGRTLNVEEYDVSPVDLYAPTQYDRLFESAASETSELEEAEREQQRQLALSIAPDRGSTLRQPEHYRNTSELLRLRLELCEEWIKTHAARPPMSAPFMFLNKDQVIELFYLATQLKRERDTFSNQMRSVANRAMMLQKNNDRNNQMLEAITTKFMAQKKRAEKAEEGNEVLARELEDEYEAHDGEVQGLRRELEKKEADWQQKLEALKTECERASIMEKNETISQVNWKIRRVDGVPEFIHRHLQSAATEDNASIPSVAQIKEQLDKSRSFPDLCLFLWSLDVHVHFEQLAKTLHVREHLCDISKVFAPVIVRLITFLEQKLCDKTNQSSKKDEATRPELPITPAKGINLEASLTGMATLNSENEELKKKNEFLQAQLAKLHEKVHQNAPSSISTISAISTAPSAPSLTIDTSSSSAPLSPSTSTSSPFPSPTWFANIRASLAAVDAHLVADMAKREARIQRYREEDAELEQWCQDMRKEDALLQEEIRRVSERWPVRDEATEAALSYARSLNTSPRPSPSSRQAKAYGDFGFEKKKAQDYGPGCSPLTGMPRLPMGPRYGR